MRLDVGVSETLGVVLVIFGLIAGIEGQYEDTRCKCVCPDPQIVTKNGTQTNRKLYISPATKCTCDYVVIPQVENIVQGKVEEFCSRCECKYESRNTTIIKVVVIFVIGIVSLLMTYMLFLMCLDPLLNKRIKSTAYQEHTNEDDESVGGGRTTHSLRMTGVTATSQGPGGTSTVLNRVGHQQNKWKRQICLRILLKIH
ncbi:unnamed protein product [Allacma fusca]|uniref:Transmembrane protein 9 n=1 Tax=Allacma fusca TaxID=39272 RepID=A0A8J2KHB5_9HEXA|nr:unnamed protein product [Allacma fusca]